MGTNVVRAATELFRQRNFAQVVTTCRADLGARPDDVRVRILLARALMALRRDGEAQSEVSAALRHDPTCAEAYQLLGELAFRRDELRAAEIFLRDVVGARVQGRGDERRAGALADLAQPHQRGSQVGVTQSPVRLLHRERTLPQRARVESAQRARRLLAVAPVARQVITTGGRSVMNCIHWVTL